MFGGDCEIAGGGEREVVGAEEGAEVLDVEEGLNFGEGGGVFTSVADEGAAWCF